MDTRAQTQPQSAIERFKQLLIEYPQTFGAPCPPELMALPGAIPLLPVQVLSELIERVEELERKA